MNLKGKPHHLDFPAIMGVINLTPDSFYAASRHETDRHILNSASEMIELGVDIIDIGGHSTRPGARALTVEEETARVLPAVKALSEQFPDMPLSIDTFRSEVARAALQEGASIINDISGGQFDPAIYTVAAENQAPYILGHLRGTFDTMMQETSYNDLIGEVSDFFIRRSNQLKDSGVNDIILDPGFGFSKTVEQNYELLKNMGYFTNLGRPVLAGLSRKSMIWKLLGSTPDEALNGTTALNTIALMNGASLLRVHDVKEAMETVKLFKMMYA